LPCAGRRAIDTALAVGPNGASMTTLPEHAATPLWQFGGSADLLAKKG
jgi:hypothetical protein